MLAAIVSVEDAGAAPGGGGPAGPVPLGSFDFVTGVFTWGASVLAAADVVTHPEWITANGLEINSFSTTVAPSLIYAPARALFNTHSFALVTGLTLLANRDLVHYWRDLVNPISLSDTGTSEAEYFKVWQAGAGAGGVELDEIATSGSTSRQAWDFLNGLAVGAHKVAFTRSGAYSRVALDGVVNADDGANFVSQPDTSASEPNAFNDFTIGGVQGVPYDNGSGPVKWYLRKFDFYSALNAADLALACA